MASAATISAPLLRRLRQAGWREALLWLLVIAMVMRAVLPVGFMPAIGQNAKGLITICSGGSFKQVTAVQGSGEQQEPATHKSNHDCVLCAAPVQSAGPDFVRQIFAVFFAVVALHFIVWLGLNHRRYTAVAIPRAPPCCG